MTVSIQAESQLPIENVQALVTSAVEKKRVFYLLCLADWKNLPLAKTILQNAQSPLL